MLTWSICWCSKIIKREFIINEFKIHFSSAPLNRKIHSGCARFLDRLFFQICEFDIWHDTFVMMIIDIKNVTLYTPRFIEELVHF